MAEKDIPTLWYAATMSRPNFGQDATCEVFTSKNDAAKYVKDQGGRPKVHRVCPGLYTYENDRGMWIEEFYVFREDKAHQHGLDWARIMILDRRFSAEERCPQCRGHGYYTNDRGTRLLCYGCMGTGMGKK